MKPKWVKVATAVFVVAAALGIAYAATQLQISNTVNVNVGANLKAIIVGAVTTAPTCSALTGTYVETGLSMTWAVNQGSSQTQYICIQNVGTSADSLSVATNPLTLPNGLTLASTVSICTSTCTSGTSLPPSGFALATVSLSASQSSTIGTNTFVITIT